MPPKEKVKLNEPPEINLIWTSDEVQLLLESVKKFITPEVCGSTTVFYPTTSLLFSENIFLFFFLKCKIIYLFFPSYERLWHTVIVNIPT